MNSLMIKLRAGSRRIGLHGLVYRIQHLRKNAPYEEAFNRALRSVVRPGDVVWDVGANVGLYAELFCNWVGPNGRVVAFEPNPEPFAQIERRLGACAWLSLMNLALSSSEGVCSLVVHNGYSLNAHIRFEDRLDTSDKSEIRVPVSTGDAICRRAGHVPNVIKIDVEGFEDEVLAGLEETLSSPSLRAVLLEVHLQALQDRGRPTAAIEIERLLRHKGFGIKWVDKNHLKAERVARA